MAHKRHYHGKKKMPVTILMPALLHLYPTAKDLVEGKMDTAAYDGLAIGAGGKFDSNKAIGIAAPYIIGYLAHVTIGKKMNRYVPKWSPVNI